MRNTLGSAWFAIAQTHGSRSCPGRLAGVPALVSFGFDWHVRRAETRQDEAGTMPRFLETEGGKSGCTGINLRGQSGLAIRNHYPRRRS